MKTKLLTVVCTFILFFGYSQAVQEKPVATNIGKKDEVEDEIEKVLGNKQGLDTVVIDFKKRGNPGKQVIKKEGVYYIIVKNINQNLYNIRINKKDSTITSEVKFPTFADISSDALTALISKLIPKATSSTSGEGFFERSQFSWIEQKSNMLSDKLLENKSNEKRNFIALELNKYIDSLKKINDEISNRSLEIKKLNNNLVTLKNSYYVEDNSNEESVELKEFLLEEGGKTNDIKTVISDFKKIKHSVDVDLPKKITDKKQNFTKFYDNNKVTIDKEFEKENKLITKGFSVSDSLAKQLSLAVSNEKASPIFENLIHLNNNVSKVYISLGQQLNSELNNITVTIEPKDPSYKLQSYTTQIQVKEDKKTYIGVSANIYYSGLYDDVYSYKEKKISNTESEFTIVNEKPKKYEIGLMALLNYGWRNDHMFGVHLSLGPAISIAKEAKPRLAIGGGIGYGDKQMITLNVLAIGGTSERLSDVYAEDTVYYKAPGNITISKQEISYAFSLGYIYKF